MGIDNVKNIKVLQSFQVIIEWNDGKQTMTQVFAQNQPEAVSRVLEINKEKLNADTKTPKK